MDLNIKITGYYPGSGSKSSELTIDFNTSFTSINNDIVMINAGNQFLFTKYTITNEHYINYLNDILELLTNDENLIYNSSNQKIMNTNNSRIVFNDVDTLIVDNDTTITSASFSISDDEYINHPVTGVTWYGAENYANHFGWRLPTIDEWKYIASGDSINWKYPYLNQQANHSWVDTSQTNCNFNREQQNTTTNVEKFESNISYFGAVDIIGNVYELTSSQDEQSENL